MGLTADDLSQVLAVCCGEEPDGRAEAVALVRQSQPSFAASLYSAWEAEGAVLDAGLRHDLAVARARIEYYRQVAHRLRGQVPGLLPIKGLEVADLYPDGMARGMNDLDYVALTEPDLWKAVGWLVEDGWDQHTATFSRHRGELQIMVSLRRPHENPYVLPYGVELANYFASGDMGGVRPLSHMPGRWQAPVVKNALMLIYERFEQPYRARDLVDITILLESATAADLAALRAAIDRLGLEPEYAELAALVERAGLGPLSVPPTAGWVAPATRARRILREIAALRRPASGVANPLQRRLVRGDQTSYERWAWAAAQRMLAVSAAMRAGMLAFGLPVEGPAPEVDTAVLRERNGMSWIDTPVARYALTIGDEVAESAVRWLTSPAPPPTGPQ